MPDTSSLISTGWLADNLNDSDIRIIDATWHLPTSPRNALKEFEEDHIPGALFFDIDEIADLDNPLPHMMPKNDKMSARIRAMGINKDDHIIVYDNSGFCTAARVWFMFKNYGHKNVSILDGGIQKWKSEGRPTENISHNITSSHYTAQKNEDRIRSIEQVTGNIVSKKEQLVDARAAGRFLGTAPEPRPDSKSGHIPQSLNVPFSDLLNEDKTYKSKAEIKAVFKKNGVDLTKPVITSCGSGVTACVLIFALEQIGHTQSALYDGSWSQWGTHPDTVIEK